MMDQDRQQQQKSQWHKKTQQAINMRMLSPHRCENWIIHRKTVKMCRSVLSSFQFVHGHFHVFIVAPMDNAMQRTHNIRRQRPAITATVCITIIANDPETTTVTLPHLRQNSPLWTLNKCRRFCNYYVIIRNFRFGDVCVCACALTLSH